MSRGVFLLIFPIMLAACSKKTGSEKDVTSPVVVINEPSNNQVFTGNQVITISGTVTDDKHIREIHIEISNLATGQQYLHVHIQPDVNPAAFSQTFAVEAGKTYKIRVIADDGSSNSTAKTIEITCN